MPEIEKWVKVLPDGSVDASKISEFEKEVLGKYKVYGKVIANPTNTGPKEFDIPKTAYNDDIIGNTPELWKEVMVYRLAIFDKKRDLPYSWLVIIAIEFIEKDGNSGFELLKAINENT